MKQKSVVVTGEVHRAPVRQGTASAHVALVLTTDDGEELILQKLGTNPFVNPDADLLDGRRVEIEGYRLGRVLRYADVPGLQDAGRVPAVSARKRNRSKE